ncbi:MAG TPA: glycosyltransferase, partial [Candidatus Kapabacteria bacterium]|nr:glycosyltransferase [Candidatus Kapabacteria bacterium]
MSNLVNNPLVSVRILTYNHEKYIAQCIEGIVSQKTNFPFEIIIGEDCSTDATRQICRNYKEKYPDIINLIENERNLGVVANGERTIAAYR